MKMMTLKEIHEEFNSELNLSTTRLRVKEIGLEVVHIDKAQGHGKTFYYSREEVINNLAIISRAPHYNKVGSTVEEPRVRLENSIRLAIEFDLEEAFQNHCRRYIKKFGKDALIRFLNTVKREAA